MLQIQTCICFDRDNKTTHTLNNYEALQCSYCNMAFVACSFLKKRSTKHQRKTRWAAVSDLWDTKAG